MKKLKRQLSILLILCMLIGFAPMPAYAEEPAEIELEEGVTYKDNGDGTATINVFQTPDGWSSVFPDDSVPQLTDACDAYASAEGPVYLELAKTFQPGEQMVSVSSNDSEISFYPEQVHYAVEATEDDTASVSGADESDELDSAPLYSDITQFTNSNMDSQSETTGYSGNSEQMRRSGTGDLFLCMSTDPADTEAIPEQPFTPESVEAVTNNSRDGGIASVAYPSAFHEDADIVFEPAKGGVKESIIIREYVTDTYSYILNLDSLTPEMLGNAVLLKDSGGKVSAALSAPYMVDAAGALSRKIQVELESLGDGKYRLVYHLDAAWLETAQFPVTVDPTVSYSFDYENYKFIENSFVAEAYPNQTAAVFAWSEQELTTGWYHGGLSKSYFRMVFPDSVIQEMDNAILKDLTLNLYIRYGSGTYSMHQVIGGSWKANTITWNNAPAYSSKTIATQTISGEGWTSWDLTEAGSSWFHSLNQAGAYGVCMEMVDGSGVCIASSLHDRDEYGLPAYYSITYYKDPSDPQLTAAASGNGINSGSGYVDLSWTASEESDNYYVGVFNGKSYEYFYVGNRTSWTTKDKGIWPTEEEINEGRYLLHGDGAGAELPMLPALSYSNADSAHAQDLNYYFIVIPANQYGQAPNPSHYTVKTIRLPDTIAPSAAQTVTVDPSEHIDADTTTVSWSGILDYNADSPSAVSSMGDAGWIEYALDGSSEWKSTGQREGDGSFTLDVSALANGIHYIAIRGVDSAGNYGAEQSAQFEIERKSAPAQTGNVSYTPPVQRQSAFLDRLYGGNYIFGTAETAPDPDRQLNTALLGSNKYCGYGFEPINFNTGNFLLETRDLLVPDLVDTAFEVLRTYNAQSEIKDGPFGARWESAWSSHLRSYDSGEIVYVAPDGAETVFVPQRSGDYTGGEARGLTLHRNAASGEYCVESRDGTRSVFTGVGLLKAIEAKDGSRIAVERDSNGLLTGFVLPSGERVRAESDANGHLVSLRLPDGRVFRYEYQGRNLVRAIDASGLENRYIYDSLGRMTEWYDAEGNCQVRNTYDTQGRVTQQTDANGGEYAMEYHDDHTVATDADGHVSEIWFDAQKRTTKSVDANGAEICYVYDQNSNITAITDALGNTTRYEYDAFGNKVKETAPDGSSYSLQYDANNNLTKLIDQFGGVTLYEYDGHNRLVRQTNPDGGVIAYAYNEAGQVLSVTDPLGNVTRYAYDGVDLVCSTDPNGNETRFAYDAQHRLVSTTDALGSTTAFAYNGQDRLVSVTFADGTSFTYTYDRLGNLTNETDALGNATEALYDEDGKLISIIAPNGNETNFTYDAGGKLNSQSIGGRETQYVYDACGRLISGTRDGESVHYTYDVMGNVTSFTTSDGQTTIYIYDSMNRVVSETAPDGVVTSYTYNLAGNLISKTDTNGDTSSFEYDSLGNILTVTDAQGRITRYTYDALNRVSSKTEPDGTVTRYQYDVFGNAIKEQFEPSKANAAAASFTAAPQAARGSTSAYPALMSAATQQAYSAVLLKSGSNKSGSVLASLKNAVSSAISTVKSWGTAIADTAAKVASAIGNAVTKAINTINNAVSGSGKTSSGKNATSQKSNDTPASSPSSALQGGGSRPASVSQTPVNPAWSPVSGQRYFTDTPSVSRWDSVLCKIEDGKNTALDILSALQVSTQQAAPQLAIAGKIMLADGPEFGPADSLGILFGIVIIGGIVYRAGEIYKDGNQIIPYLDLEPPKLPTVIPDPLPEQRQPEIETFPEAGGEKESTLLPEPMPQESPGLQTTSPMVPDAENGNIITASDIPEMQLDQLPKNVQESFKKYDDAGWKGNVSGQTSGTNAGRSWANRDGQLPDVGADGNPITYREFDVNDYNGVDRGTERFVVGSDGSVYYTDSHYGRSTSLNGIDDFVKLK